MRRSVVLGFDGARVILLDGWRMRGFEGSLVMGTVYALFNCVFYICNTTNKNAFEWREYSRDRGSLAPHTSRERQNRRCHI